MRPPTIVYWFTIGLMLSGGALAADSTAAGNQLLKLNQWDWKQAIEAPRQGKLQRSRDLPVRQQQQIRRQLDEQRRSENQLYERQRQQQLATPRGSSQTPSGAQGNRRLQQQQMQRFKAESNNLRLQQDIQRRAFGGR